MNCWLKDNKPIIMVIWRKELIEERLRDKRFLSFKYFWTLEIWKSHETSFANILMIQEIN